LNRESERIPRPDSSGLRGIFNAYFSQSRRVVNLTTTSPTEDLGRNSTALLEGQIVNPHNLKSDSSCFPNKPIRRSAVDMSFPLGTQANHRFNKKSPSLKKT
jgi:hypothetical protein